MNIIVGLGNPGKKYENTRHNIGFKTIDVLAERNNIEVNKLKFKALVGEGFINNKKVLLVKPQTFMNLSGEAVREVLAYYKEPVENLLVIYDDIDIATGTFRIRKKGSAGTHNGMRNIIYLLNDDGFPRIRIGIGSALKGDLINFVVGNVTKDESELLYPAVIKSCEAIECYLKDGIDMAMNRFNVKKKVEE
ncbi:MAG: aminoacyl-tRNA hydrolase [Clostridia bacterium]|nr:aminoacyl-tRNA hydrolase [Clostridia bacterium]